LLVRLGAASFRTTSAWFEPCTDVAPAHPGCHPHFKATVFVPSSTYTPAAAPAATEPSVPMPAGDSCDDLAGNMRMITSCHASPCCRSRTARVAVYDALLNCGGRWPTQALLAYCHADGSTLPYTTDCFCDLALPRMRLCTTSSHGDQGSSKGT
jgi:hypothetical protein